MKNLNLRQLEAFRAVMLGKTITRAAELLFISQPAVSRLIKDLETSIDFPLFERRKKRLYPTPEAHAMYKEVERSFSGLEAIQNAAREIREFQSGSLSIAALPALGLGFLPGVISEFAAQRPNVPMSLSIRSSQKVSALVAAQSVDIGFTAATDFDSGVESEILLATKMVCILPDGHPLCAKHILHPQDIDGVAFIGDGTRQSPNNDIVGYFAAKGIKRKIQIDTQLHASVGDFVKAGAGISLVDPITADQFSSSGVQTRPFMPPIEFKFYVLYSENCPRSRLTQKFIELLGHRLERFAN